MTAHAVTACGLAQIADGPPRGRREVTSMSTGIAGALEGLRRNAAADLKDLRRNWGSAYEITGALGGWRAVRRDSQVMLIATSPGKLRDLITADYTARPVPRSCPCPQIRPGVTECGASAQTRDADDALARAREGLSEWPGLAPPLPAIPHPHPLMTPGEVADVFQVDPRTIWRWEAAGELDSVRLPSGVRRYFRAQVEVLLRGDQLTPAQMRALREQLASPRTRPRRCADSQVRAARPGAPQRGPAAPGRVSDYPKSWDLDENRHKSPAAALPARSVVGRVPGLPRDRRLNGQEGAVITDMEHRLMKGGKR